MLNDKFVYAGIDLGSVSLCLAVLDGKEIRTNYEQVKGRPIDCLVKTLETEREFLSGKNLRIYGTGSGRELISRVLGIEEVNEISAHGRASVYFYPNARTVIEIGGQDSKIIRIESGQIVDSAMNEICAAGTGSFFDQQAENLGISIDDFSELALKSSTPADIAGRCAVFAKTDIIHSFQKGHSKEDIAAGLCYALARNYISNLGKGKKFETPILFQGGVAANKGMIAAFRSILKLSEGELIVPPYFREMGAIGAALISRERQGGNTKNIEELVNEANNFLDRSEVSRTGALVQSPKSEKDHLYSKKGRINLGIDVGSTSVSIIAMNEENEFIDGLYLRTEGNPLKAIEKGFSNVEYKPEEVMSLGITGSGRYLIGELLGADKIVNEITAQANATLHFHDDVDSIIEIGGQDSKFIKTKDGNVVDFIMNKVCAAGTGSFIEEQLKRLGLNLREGIDLAFSSENPVDLQSRCTVFMESDLVHYRQQGIPLCDLAAGIMYAVSRNYLEKVVQDIRQFGENIFFQGGVSLNPAVISAFESILDKKINVTMHSKHTGAIGAALLASGIKGRTKFRGFETPKGCTYKRFNCQDCNNRCEIIEMKLNSNRFFYGGRCGKFDSKLKSERGRNLYNSREQLLFG